MRIMRAEGINTRGLRELCKILSPGTTMAEIGTFAGESCRIFLESGNVYKIHCIDQWKDSPGKDYLEAEKVFDGWSASDPRIVKVKAESAVAAAKYGEASFDFVYIDANHNFQNITRDIALWSPKVRKGGLLGGHDFSYKFIGVIQAVWERFGKPDHVFCDGSWIVRVE